LLKDTNSYKKVRSGFSNYTLGKDNFIKHILDKAGFHGFSVNFCLHDNELEAYHNISAEGLNSKLGDNTHYHFVLYKGTRIVTVAHAELNKIEARIHFISTDAHYQNYDYGIYIMSFIGKWVKISVKNGFFTVN